jgi:ADP-ribose pyrophosphatase YjhB (NUDIX family)
VNTQPSLVAANGRRFAGFAAAVLVFIIDTSSRRLLLLSSPAKRGRPGWEIVNGGLEAGETLLEGVLREVAEEAGPEVRLRVLGAVHASTWRYDDLVPHRISTFFVASYLGGDVVPGDDMAGSTVRWVTQAEVAAMVADGEAMVPEEVWVFDRAFECFDAWVASDVTL